MATKILMDMQGGLKMPAIGIGTWQVTDSAELENALNVAFEAGYRHIDTAFAYGNEAIVGRVLDEWLSSGKIKREELFITTKLPIFGVNESRVEMFLKKSLKNLRLDYVDLYLIHFPVGTEYNKEKRYQRVPVPTDHIEIWKKMEEQVNAGRTKTIGLSNFNLKQIEKILNSAKIKPACLQVELHVYLQQHELVDFCHQNNIVVVGYSPLGTPGFNKFLEKLGKKKKKLPDMLNNPTIKQIGKKHKKTSAQVMLRYLLQRNVAAIPKSATPSRIKENIDILDFSLDSEDMKILNDLEVGEEARIFDSKVFLPLEEHPEWPFPK